MFVSERIKNRTKSPLLFIFPRFSQHTHLFIKKKNLTTKRLCMHNVECPV